MTDHKIVSFPSCVQKVKVNCTEYVCYYFVIRDAILEGQFMCYIGNAMTCM